MADTVPDAGMLDKEAERRKKMVDIFHQDLEVPEEAKEQLLQFLQEHHVSFALEEHERGDTDLIQLEIDTGDATPRKQRTRTIRRGQISIATSSRSSYLKAGSL